MSEYLWPVVVLVLLTAGVVLHIRRARRMVSHWAAANGVTVLKQHWVFYRLSPWPLVWFGHQTVRYLSVRDSQGQVRRVWLLLGHLLWGLTDRVQAVWES